jgi:hypothetical protein
MTRVLPSLRRRVPAAYFVRSAIALAATIAARDEGVAAIARPTPDGHAHGGTGRGVQKLSNAVQAGDVAASDPGAGCGAIPRYRAEPIGGGRIAINRFAGGYAWRRVLDMKLVSRLLTGVVGLSMLVAVSGCAETTGAAVGAGAGAAIGAGTGYGAGKGALIGAGTGAVAGGVYDLVRHK